MRNIMALSVVNAIFIFCVFISVSEALYYVNYITTSACATPQGCNFADPTIWDLGYNSINSSAIVVIKSFVPITITIYGLNVACYAINLDGDINLVILNSKMNVMQYLNAFDGTASVIIDDSVVNFSRMNVTGTVSLLNSSEITVTNQMTTYDDVTCQDSSTIQAGSWAAFSGTQTITSCLFQIGLLTSFNFYADGVQLISTISRWNVGPYTSVKNSLLTISDFFSSDNSVQEFIDCQSNMETVYPGNQTTLSFLGTSSSSSSQVTISYYRTSTSRLVVGDDVTATIDTGSFYDLSVGNQSLIFFTSEVTVYSITQRKGNSFFQISEEVVFNGTFTFSGDIELLEGSMLTVYDNVTVIGNHTINGNGTLKVVGNFACPFIEIPNLDIEDEAIITSDTIIVYLIQMDMPKVGTINGNVQILESPYSGVNLNGPLFVNGNFFQKGGFHNLTLSDYVTMEYPFLMINGMSNINGTNLVYHLSLTSQKKWWLLHINNSNNAGYFRYDSMGFDFAHVKGDLSVSTTDIYLKLIVAGEGFVVKYTWALVLASVVLAISIAFAFHQIKSRHNRVEYVPIRDGIMGG